MRNPEEERLAEQAEQDTSVESQRWNATQRFKHLLKEDIRDVFAPDVQWDKEHVIHDL
jgi:hypothetical protein